MKILERKVRYDGTVSEYECQVVKREREELVLLYEIQQGFRMKMNGQQVHIPAETITVGFYWEDRPYNVYHWRTKEGTYLGSYFNMVKDTTISGQTVSYVDLIVDLMVLPDGSHAVLDLDELPEEFSAFENGSVKRDLQRLLERKGPIIDYLINETDRLISEQSITSIQLP